MNLREKIDVELKESMKARDQLRTETIRNIRSAVQYKEVEEASDGQPLDEAGIMKVIAGLAKQRRDSIDQFSAAGRAELAAKEEKELAILQTFLPEQLSETELAELVSAAIAEVGATDMKAMGAVIKAAQAKAAGRAEGRAISELVKKKLSGG